MPHAHWKPLPGWHWHRFVLPITGCALSIHIFLHRLRATAVLLCNRNPPNIALQKKTVTMRASVRQSDTSLSSGWRDDSPQKICTLQHDSLYNAQASRFIFCNFFKSFAYSFEGAFRRAYFNLEDSFVFLPVSVFWRIVSKPHHFGSAVCVRPTFYLFQKFFGKRLLLPLALCPSSSASFRCFRFRSCKSQNFIGRRLLLPLALYPFLLFLLSIL